VGYNSVTIFIRLAIVACQICEIPRNSTKIQIYSSSRSSKVTDLGVNRKRICSFLLVIISNHRRISYHFWDIDAFSSKIAFPPHPCLTPPSRGTPCNINVIYTPLKSTYNGLQFCRRHYGSIFIHLAAVGSQNREITRNSTKIWPYSTSNSSKVIDLGVIRKHICDFLLVLTNSNFVHISYRFWDIDA